MPSKGRKLELQTLNSLHGAADDARLQRQRWLRAIALLVGQDSDPLAKFLDPGMSTRGSISSEERASQFGVRLEDAPVAEGEFAGRQVPTTLLLMWAELNGRAKDGLELVVTTLDFASLAEARAVQASCRAGASGWAFNPTILLVW